MIAGAILAAGEGRRFGGPKQVAELDGRPLLEHAIAAMTAVPALQRVVVVLGAHAGAVREAVRFDRAEPVECAQWQQGMSASLRCALKTLPEADPLVIALGDQPGITSEAVEAVLAAVLADPGLAAARAVYGGVPSHPVALRPALLEGLSELRGDAGARELLARANTREVECGELGAAHDVDTPEQLEELRS